MKVKRIFCLFFTVLCSMMFLTVPAFASNELTPYEPGQSASSAPSQQPQQPAQQPSGNNGTDNGDVPDYAGSLFQETEFTQNETVQGIVQTIANIASALITFVLGAITSILTIGMVIDICCLLIKPLTVGLSRLPIQLFSDEISAITGIQYVGTTEGNSGGNVEKVDLKGKPAFLYYIEKKAFLIIPSIVILILLGTGLLFKGIFFVSNYIVSFFANMVG